MLRKTRFYIGLTLIIQSLTFIAMSIVLFVKQKKSYAGVTLAFGAAGGIAGAVMIFKQIRRVIDDDRILEVMDELLDDEDLDYRPYSRREIPIDDTADEGEFSEN